jgi:hypothetical protein
MTEFMVRMAAALAEPTPVPPAPQVKAAGARSVGHGAHEMVELRSLAEQLVCEANAVLAGTGREVMLVDEAGSTQLAFTLRSGTSWARVVTAFEDRQSFGQLVTPDRVGPRYELAGPEALPDLVVALVTSDGRALELAPDA